MGMSIDEAIRHLDTYSSTMGSGQTTQEQHEDAKRVAVDTMCKYQKLEQELTVKNDLGVDCISRARAIERLKLNLPISQGADNSRDRHRYMQALADIQAIRELPSVTPQEPKTGHWKAFIHDAYHGTDEDGEPIWREVTVYHCSQCNRRTVIKEKYCPNCGAKMVEPQESEG